VGAASVAASALAFGQAAAPATPEEVVQMSKFEVTTTQGHGYVSTNSASAFKTNTSLLDLPQIDTVITRDLIDDIGFVDSSNVTQYFGLSNFYAGEAFAARGYRITYAYVDDMPSNQPYEDNSYIDSYELIKGPAQVLYLNASLGGTVLKSTKKPLPYSQNVATFSINSGSDHYLYRATIDSTGPLGMVGDAKVGYRLVMSYRGGASYWHNDKEEMTTIFPVVQVDWKNTTARLYVYFLQGVHRTAGMSLITPTGDLYNGAGRAEGNYLQGSMEHWEAFRYNGKVDTRISSNWENSVALGQWNLHRFGPVSINNAVNWDAGTINFLMRENNIKYSYWAFLDDIQGHYNWGPFKNTDAFGGGWDEYTVIQRTWTSTAIGIPYPTVAMNNAAAIDALAVPSASQFSPDAYPQQGLHNQTVVTALYWQHTIDIVPNYLTLVGGWTWSNITTEGTANLSNVPWTTITTPSSRMLHRYGIVFKPTKDISFYAMDSGSFSPPTQGAILANGTLPPAQLGKGTEIGMKTALFGGKISTNLATFKMTTTNVLSVGGTLPNGLSYWVPVGSTVQQGVDGDIAVAVMPGWQIIASGYAGHDRDQLGKPVSNSYDNQWAFFSRYDFQPDSPLKGWAVGAGIVRVGGRWISTSGMTYSSFNPYTAWSGEIKLKTGTLVNAFVNYQVNKHLQLRLNCQNALDERYVLGEQTALIADPSVPRTFVLEVDYKL